ncbi:MAG: hypothetical protein ABSF09_09335 [Candidatus Bathyarchaeia archaeon]
MSENAKPLLELKKEARQVLLKAISKDPSIVRKIRSEDLQTLVQLDFIKNVKTSNGLTYIITPAGLRLLEEYHAMQV